MSRYWKKCVSHSVKSITLRWELLSPLCTSGTGSKNNINRIHVKHNLFLSVKFCQQWGVNDLLSIRIGGKEADSPVFCCRRVQLLKPVLVAKCAVNVV